MILDGGLIEAIESDIESKASTTLSGFNSLDADFTSEENLDSDLRLVVKMGQNRMINTTDRSEYRRIIINLEVWGKTRERVKTQASKVAIWLNSLSENSETITAEMTESAEVVELDLIDCVSNQISNSLWVTRFTTEWLIGVSRVSA